MKKLKQNIMIVLVVIITITMLCLPMNKVFAGRFTNSVEKENAEIVMSMMADKTKLKAGETVTITLAVDTCPTYGLRAFGYRLIYDSSKLEYLGGETGPVGKEFSGANPFERESSEKEKEFETARTVTDSGYTGNGLRMTGIIDQIKFKVKENVAVGEIKMYIIEESKGGFNTASAFADGTTNSFAPFYVETNINQLVVERDNVVPYSKGDVNGDGSIDTEDAVLILKHLAGNVTLAEEQEQAADTNTDSTIDTEDAVLILKYLAGNITEL